MLSQQAGVMPAGQETLPSSWYISSWLGAVGRLSCQAATLPAGREAPPTSWYCTSLARDSPGKLVQYQLFGKAVIVQASGENVLTTCYHTGSLGSSPDKLAALAVGAAL
ncbi:hypothetical protein PCASD_19850 [Puccinia coronata f. sp. avenae]|uniref:Uncharacterized protein n=1 Tax=Puccinia coronata f. sp. avenae TaxID=200324 RepID=A0A2N5SKY5_9BASI|nr:hypothetical protein PCASD_19850 [Puccinia coronata f. sp. avenae]